MSRYYLLLLLGLFGSVHAEESIWDELTEPAFGLWSVGVVAKQSPYHDVDTQVSPALLIFGGYGDVFAEGNRFGYSVYRDGTNFISVVGNIRSNLTLTEEQIDDSSVLSTYNLEERKTALEAGVQIGRRLPMGWIGRVAFLQDISGAHKAQEIDATVFRRDEIGPIRLLTTFGIQAQSKQLNDYYFGIDNKELALPAQEAYQADAGFSGEIELIATYDFKLLGKHDLGVYAAVRNYYFSETVKDSPLVDKPQSETFFAGVGYYF